MNPILNKHESNAHGQKQESNDQGISLFKSRLSAAMRSIPCGEQHEDLREGIEYCLLNIKTGAPKSVVYNSLIDAATIFTHYMVVNPNEPWQNEVARAFAGDEAI